MASPRHPDNRPETSEGAVEVGVEAKATEADAEERGEKKGDEAAGPP